MWKDYFYLNKRERSALWVFTVLIVLTQMAIWTVPAWLPRLTGLLVNKGQPTDSLALPLAEDGFGKTDRPRYDRRETGRWSYGKPCVVRRPFNPNTADSATLVSLGLKPWVAKNIVKYRRKGGQFRKPEDLSKIYGLESSTFRALLPYIRIEPEAAAEGKQAKPSDPKAGDRPGSISESGGTAPEKVASATAIQTKRPDALQTNAGTEASGLLAGNFELNSADTSTLQLLKGVGAVTAARIVRYGSQLGGYYTVSQLTEIKGIYPAALSSLQRSLSVNPALIRKININKVSLERLRAHPYIDFYQAKVIIGLRTARKGIKALSELAAFKEFSAEDIDRLKWYVEL